MMAMQARVMVLDLCMSCQPNQRRVQSWQTAEGASNRLLTIVIVILAGQLL